MKVEELIENLEKRVKRLENKLLGTKQSSGFITAREYAVEKYGEGENDAFTNSIEIFARKISVKLDLPIGRRYTKEGTVNTYPRKTLKKAESLMEDEILES